MKVFVEKRIRQEVRNGPTKKIARASRKQSKTTLEASMWSPSP